MALSAEDRLKLRERCALVLPGFATPSPADEFRRMADWCAANGVSHDVYGEGALIEAFERRIAELTGKAAAAFMPSGVMAQLIAVRLWTERAGIGRFGLHPTSHLILHEREAWQALFGLHGAVVGERLRPMTAADLEAQPEPLACLIVELPIREAGGQLPTWDELEALKALAARRGIPLHMDGARLWESRAFYGRPYAEIAESFASVYVSAYKGLGGIAGALLAGDEAFVDQARVWRRRMGGTLVHQSPMIVSAAMRLDERLAAMDACYARTLALAEGLAAIPGFRVNPVRPQANMLHLYIEAPADQVLERRDAIAGRDGVWVIGGAKPAEVPGWCVSELYVGDTLVDHANDEVLPLFRALLG
ncbi:MAG TPA: beta-eliminating lyase-related protein [Caulobacteraceae bacterium]|nr:beta-eliminating lyase-related protein [Caulobacteraceae bacterium]